MNNKSSKQMQREALALQMRQSNRAAEDAAAARAENGASGRRIRGLGRRSLAFLGVETGLAPTLAG